jgi:hypothetical protein
MGYFSGAVQSGRRAAAEVARAEGSPAAMPSAAEAIRG